MTEKQLADDLRSKGWSISYLKNGAVMLNQLTTYRALRKLSDVRPSDLYVELYDPNRMRHYSDTFNAPSDYEQLTNAGLPDMYL